MRAATLLIFLSISPLFAEDAKLPEGPGRATTARLCGSCHGLGNFIRRRESRDGWNAVIEEMIRRGAKGDEAEWAEISDYLFAQFSNTKVNINKATAEVIAEKLSLSADQAAAIVKHREANGKFSSFDDLQKVTGLDAAALQPKQSLIDF